MQDVYLLGIHATPCARMADRSFQDLAREAWTGALADAGLEHGHDIGHVWFSNLLMDYWGQPYIRGQVALAPLERAGALPPNVPVTNVEGGCASASLAFNGAWKEVRSGQSEVALALGVEKLHDPANPAAVLAAIEGGTDRLDPAAWHALYARIAAAGGREFAPGPGRSLAMDVYALWAGSHMRRYGTTAAHIAHAAAKNHTNAVHNPRAQYRFAMSVDEVLADRAISEPLTRAMCAPTGDGAAAALLCSARYLAGMPLEVRDRALRIRAQGLAGGRFDGDWDTRRAPVVAAERAYAQAGIAPRDLDLIELHDATAFAEIHLVEDLGLCPRGQGGPFTASGATARDGEIPVNPSGGLVSRGHPIGATGLMMLNELALQLRGAAGELQVPDARIALAENGGGLYGNDVAVCAVTILERP